MSSDNHSHSHDCDSHGHDHEHDHEHTHSHDCQHEHVCDHDEIHEHSHDSHDSHGPSHAGEIIPETSLQDMVLKLVTVAAAGLLIGTMGWWATLPLESGHEAAGSHGQEHGEGHEQSQH
jgi:hypothetical protein